jgi:hypothetical protein
MIDLLKKPKKVARSLNFDCNCDRNTGVFAFNAVQNLSHIVFPY